MWISVTRAVFVVPGRSMGGVSRILLFFAVAVRLPSTERDWHLNGAKCPRWFLHGDLTHKQTAERLAGPPGHMSDTPLPSLDSYIHRPVTGGLIKWMTRQFSTVGLLKMEDEGIPDRGSTFWAPTSEKLN